VNFLIPQEVRNNPTADRYEDLVNFAFDPLPNPEQLGAHGLAQSIFRVLYHVTVAAASSEQASKNKAAHMYHQALDTIFRIANFPCPLLLAHMDYVRAVLHYRQLALDYSLDQTDLRN
jgi:hypothetical protein